MEKIFRSLMFAGIILLFCMLFFTACEPECLHNVEQWTVTKNPDCEQIGSKTGVCVLCGAQIENPIAAVGHDWEITNCLTDKNCRICGKTESAEFDHTNKQYQTIDLSEYGACQQGGISPLLRVYQCMDCGTAIRIMDYRISCGELILSDSFQDENGNRHDVYTLDCDACGLSFRSEQWRDTRDALADVSYRRYTLTKGEQVIVDCTEKKEADDHTHEYDVTYEMQGGDCEQGYLETTVCTICGESAQNKRKGHRLKQFHVDLAAFVPCGGNLVVESCDVCKQILAVLEFELNCVLGENHFATWTDADGSRHERTAPVCLLCGTARVEEGVYIPTETPCQRNRILTYAIEQDGVQTYSVTTVGTLHSEHDYEYTCDLSEGNCTDGHYTLFSRCKLCGDEMTNTQYTHFYKRKNVQFGCGSRITVKQCVACSALESEPTESIRCNFEIIQTEENAAKEACTVCGAERKTETETLPDYIVNCPIKLEMGKPWVACHNCQRRYDVCALTARTGLSAEEYAAYLVENKVACTDCGAQLISLCKKMERTTVTITENGTEICSFVQAKTNLTHEYKAKAEMLGESCIDGWIRTLVCLHCAETHEYTFDGHIPFSEEQYELSDYGVCGGYVRYQSCPCGYSEDMYYELSCNTSTEISIFREDGVEHCVYIYRCSDCSLILSQDTYFEMRGCMYYYVENLRVTVEGEEIFSLFSKNVGEERHTIDYVLTMFGDSCEDGGHIVGNCTLCGTSVDRELNGHEMIMMEVKIPEETSGICGGSYVICSCPCGYYEYLMENLHCDFTWVDDPDIEKSVGTCKNCGLVWEMLSEMHTENGSVCIYRTDTLTMSDGTVLVPTFTYLETRMD